MDERIHTAAPPGRGDTSRQARADRIQRRLDPVLLVAALLVIPTLVLEEARLGDPYDQIGVVLNWSAWSLFAAEVAIMLAVVPRRRTWLRGHLLDVAIVVLTPPFAPTALQSLRLFRLLPLLRLVKAAQLTRNVFSLGGLKWATFISVVTILTGGMAFAAVERGAQDVGTWDGIWWALTTVTTVGYGDYSPQTGAGRVIALGVMGIGIGFVALITAAAAERFIRGERDDGDRHAEIIARLDELSERVRDLERRA